MNISKHPKRERKKQTERERTQDSSKKIFDTEGLQNSQSDKFT